MKTGRGCLQNLSKYTEWRNSAFVIENNKGIKHIIQGPHIQVLEKVIVQDFKNITEISHLVVENANCK